eukprot:3933688-Rhodomonas_salina.1
MPRFQQPLQEYKTETVVTHPQHLHAQSFTHTDLPPNAILHETNQTICDTVSRYVSQVSDYTRLVQHEQQMERKDIVKLIKQYKRYLLEIEQTTAQIATENLKQLTIEREYSASVRLQYN